MFAADPYPVLAEVREREPVHYDAVIKRWVLTRFDDVDEVLRDRTLAVDARKAAPGTYMAMFAERDREPSMLMQDDPTHARLRGLVNKTFTPRAVELLAPRIQEIVDELLDAVTGSESFDLIGAFAGPLPTIVIAEMLGVDAQDRADFKRWSDDGVASFDPFPTDEVRAKVLAANTAMDAYFRRVLAERRAAPRDDMMSALLAVEEDGQKLSEEEIVTMCSLVLAAGNVTTTDLIGNGVYALLTHPDEWRQLRDDPSLIKNAVEEMLRYETPVVQTGRILTSDGAIAGCPVRAHESVLTSLAAANRDPAVYPEPDRFDITRSDVRHHSFGGGSHFCLGAPLARLEAQLAISTLVRRFPELRMADEPLEWRRIPAFRGLVKLTVRPA